jgi:hypothetical protein
MTKNNKGFLLGVLFGFIGMAFYALALNGFESVGIEDILNLAKQLAIPYVFTSICTAIGVEGFRNLKQEFIDFKKRITKKVTKEAEA